MSRAAIVAEAMSWLGTPYAHRQRLKGVGVDCAQLPLAVYRACGLLPEVEPEAYAAQWHLHRGEELYLDTVARFAGARWRRPHPATSSSGATAAPSATAACGWTAGAWSTR